MRVFRIFLMSILIMALVLPVLAVSAFSQGTLLFEDDFESYAVDSVPSAKWWTYAYQEPTDGNRRVKHFDGSQRLLLYAQNWSATAIAKTNVKLLDSSIEADLYIIEGTRISGAVGLSLRNNDSSVTNIPHSRGGYNIVYQPYDDTISIAISDYPNSDTLLAQVSYNIDFDTWYKVKALVYGDTYGNITIQAFIDDMVNPVLDVIDDGTKWENFRGDIAGWSSLKSNRTGPLYFDNIKIYEVEASPDSFPLYAGQDILVGNVNAWDDGDTLYVEYEITEDGWLITETHLAVGLNSNDIPQTKKGNPIPGKFPEGDTFSTPVTKATYTFDYDENGFSPGDLLYLAAHAAVVLIDETCVQEETAWGAEEQGAMQFDGKNWATYFRYETNSMLVVDTYTVGGSPYFLCFDGTNIWVTNYYGDTVSKIDIATGTISGPYPVGNGPCGICFGGGYIWVANLLSDTVSKINPANGNVVGTISVGNGPYDICFDGSNHIWVTNYYGNTVSKIDAATSIVAGTYPVGNDPYAICFDGTHIWTTNFFPDKVSKINPANGNVVSTFTVGDNPYAICFDGTHIWVANNADDTVNKIHFTTGTVSDPYPVGDGPYGICFGDGYIWVANSDDDTVSKVDPANGNVVGTITVGNAPYDICFDGTYIWVANVGDGTVSKIIP